MKLQSRQIIFGSILLGIASIQISPLKAHQKKFHVPKKASEPKIETEVIPETKINSESSNSSPTSEMKKPEISATSSPTPEEKNIGQKTLNSVNASEVNNIKLVPKPGEIIFSLLIAGTLLLYYIKRKIYK